MSYKIITDSCCDFTKKQYEENNVACVPLTVTYKGESHNNFSDEASVKAFYDELRGGVMATTSAANPDEWAAVMAEYLKQGQDVLVITFSSGLSTTYQSAVIAGEDLKEKYPDRKVYVVDSLSAALGLGLLVWYACRKRDEGYTIDQLHEWVESNKLNICHEVTIGDLETLKRGGRINSTAAFVGTMLNIKPMIYVDNEGHLINYAKSRGRKASMEAILKRFGDKGVSCDNETVFIAHGDCPEDAAELEKMVRAKYPQIKNVVTGYVGPVIGAHTGPGVLVLFFVGEHR